MRFAPLGTIIIGIGVPKSMDRKDKSFPIVNHPQDKQASKVYRSGKVIKGEDVGDIDDTYHYVLTDKMKSEITEILKRGWL